MGSSVRPQPAFVDIAQVLLRRLERVQDTLPSLVEGRPSSRVVHDLRVSCRRAEAALSLCRDLLPGEHRREVSRQLRELREACNVGRDLDVFSQWIKRNGLPVEKVWRSQLIKHRDRSHSKLREQALKFSIPGSTLGLFHRRLRKGESLDVAGSALVGRWLRLLRRLVRTLMWEGPERLHRLRIAGKQLRYATEFLLEVCPDRKLERTIIQLKRMQDLLGAIQDSVIRPAQIESMPCHNVEIAQQYRKAAEEDARAARSHWEAWLAKAPLADVLGMATKRLLVLVWPRSQ